PYSTPRACATGLAPRTVPTASTAATRRLFSGDMFSPFQERCRFVSGLVVRDNARLTGGPTSGRPSGGDNVHYQRGCPFWMTRPSLCLHPFAWAFQSLSASAYVERIDPRQIWV